MKTILTPRSLFAFVLATALALVATAAEQPTPATPAAGKQYVSYHITRGDQLGVTVFDEHDLSVTGKKIEATGGITLPMIGEIHLVGLTIVEAQTAIENAYREGRILRNPAVTITIEVYAPRTVSISGKINLPGRYEMPPDTVWTLKDLIFKAGGFQETAQGTKIKITRTMPDGSSKVFTLDAESLIRARNNANAAEANFVLEPDDIVYVPEKLI